MQFTYFGHACFMVEVAGKKLLFDPFITPNPNAKHININDIKPDIILISHGHLDHLADAASIANSSKAKLVAAYEVTTWLANQGVQNTLGMNIGGKTKIDDVTIKCVVAHHSSALPDGSNGGNPMGFVVCSAEGNFYYAGDTALTLDMQLIPKWAKLNFAVLPIGDNFTMGYEDAIEAAKFVECKTIVGVHFDTFPPIAINHTEVKKSFEQAGIKIFLPTIEEKISLS